VGVWLGGVVVGCAWVGGWVREVGGGWTKAGAATPMRAQCAPGTACRPASDRPRTRAPPPVLAGCGVERRLGAAVSQAIVCCDC